MQQYLSLAIVASQPIIVTFLLAGTGAWLAHKVSTINTFLVELPPALGWVPYSETRHLAALLQGILDSVGTSVLAKLGFNLFTPAIVFVTLAQAISLAALRELWPLILNTGISILLGLGVGYIASNVLNTPREYKNHVVTCVAFGNIGNLPLVFTSSLCDDHSALFYRQLGDSCKHLGIAYTSMNMCVAVLFQFTVAIQLLRPRISAFRSKDTSPSEYAPTPFSDPNLALELADQPLIKKTVEVHDGHIIDLPLAAKIHHVASLSDWHSTSSSGDELSPASAELLASGGSVKSLPKVQGLYLPNTPPPVALTGNSGGDSSGNQNSPPDEFRINSTPTTTPLRQQGSPTGLYSRLNSQGKPITEKPPRLGRLVCRRELIKSHWLADKMRGVDWNAIFPVPTQAAALGVFIGCIPWLKSLLYGESAPFATVREALELLGDGLIPAAIPLLGAVIYRGPGKSSLPWRVVVGTAICKLVIMPLIMTMLIVICLQLGLFKLPDAMGMLVMLLSNATPAAINMQTITVLYKHGENEMAVILFWQYLASLLTLPLFVTIFLKIITLFP